MPATARISPFHQANRLHVILDMCARLVAEHGTPATALAVACGLTDAEWVALGQDTGHYLGAAATPADETTGAVLSQLEAMLPVEADPFAGLPR